MKPYATTLLPKALFVMLLSTAVRLAIPIIIGKFALDYALEQQDLSLMMIFAGIAFVLYIVSYVANVFRIRWTNVLGQHVIYDLRSALFNHIQRLSHRFFLTSARVALFSFE